MSDETSRPVVLDTTVLSNFAASGSVSLIANVLDTPVTVPRVRDELRAGREHGHDFLTDALSEIPDTISVEEPGKNTEESDLRATLHAGEAQALEYAIANTGTLATDDLAARKKASRQSVPVTGSLGILLIGIEAGEITADTADEWLQTWRAERSYFAPVQSIRELME